MKKEIDRMDVEKVLARLKCGMLKYGGNAVVKWMLICKQARKKEEVLDDWKRAIIVSLY